MPSNSIYFTSIGSTAGTTKIMNKFNYTSIFKLNDIYLDGQNA